MNLWADSIRDSTYKHTLTHPEIAEAVKLQELQIKTKCSVIKQKEEDSGIAVCQRLYGLVLVICLPY